MSSTSPHAAGVGALLGPPQSRLFAQTARLQSVKQDKGAPLRIDPRPPPFTYHHDHTRRCATTIRQGHTRTKGAPTHGR